MYEKSVQRLKDAEAKRERLRVMKEEEELREVTGRPDTYWDHNNGAQATGQSAAAAAANASGMSLGERAKVECDLKQKKLEKLRKEKEEEDLRDYTFKPQTIKSKYSQASSSSSSPSRSTTEHSFDGGGPQFEKPHQPQPQRHSMRS